jgi:hypothetical protein
MNSEKNLSSGLHLKDLKEQSKGEDSLTSNSNSVLSTPGGDSACLKIAIKPAKFWKLIPCERGRIGSYEYIKEKILSTHGKVSSSTPFLIIFLKKSNVEEVCLSDESEWKMYFENDNNDIINFIDSKNTLKIEYKFVKEAPNQSSQEILLENLKKEEKVKKLFQENENFCFELLRSIFINSVKNETTKNKIKEDILNSNILRCEGISEMEIKSKFFDQYYEKFLLKTLEKMKFLNTIQTELANEINYEDELMFEDEDENTGNIMDVPSFNEYYKNEQIDAFRSKIISESFHFNKKN